MNNKTRKGYRGHFAWWRVSPFIFFKIKVMHYYLYLITSGEYFKFGIAKSMKDRLKAYKTHNPIFYVHSLWMGEYKTVKKIEKTVISLFKTNVGSDWVNGYVTGEKMAKAQAIANKELEVIFVSSGLDSIIANQNSYHLQIGEDTVFESVEFKVPNVKPVHYSKRNKIEPVVNGDYYVSFGCNMATPCKYLGVANNGMARLKLKCKIREYNHQESSIVFFDEFGTTPKEAVINTVTS